MFIYGTYVGARPLNITQGAVYVLFTRPVNERGIVPLVVVYDNELQPMNTSHSRTIQKLQMWVTTYFY